MQKMAKNAKHIVKQVVTFFVTFYETWNGTSERIKLINRVYEKLPENLNFIRNIYFQIYLDLTFCFVSWMLNASLHFKSILALCS